jgi:DNA polymerase-3 subunit alpha
LFGGQEKTPTILQGELPNVAPWSAAELARQEKAAVGFYLSIHPLDGYKQILSELKILNVADYEVINTGDKIALAGIISGMQVKHSKKGNRFCIFRLEDQSIGVKCLAWSEAYLKFSDKLKDNELIIVNGKVESVEGHEITIILESVRKLAEAVSLEAKKVSIILPSKNFDAVYFDDLLNTLSRNRGNCEVFLKLDLEEQINVKILSQPIRIQGSTALENELVDKGCQVAWNL